MNHSDLDRNAYMLCGPFAKRGYLRWWHSFSGISLETGERRNFFVEYLILNPVPGKPKKEQAPVSSYVRVSAGVFPKEGLPGLQISTYHKIQDCKYAKKPLYFQVDDNVLRENRITGRVNEVLSYDAFGDPDQQNECDWDLEIHKTICCHTGFLASPFFCAMNALDSFWHGEGIKTHFRGRITLNGEDFEVLDDDCNGYADKHWGRSYHTDWLQLASCTLLSERTGKILKHSAFALDGCCPRFLFLRFQPKLILQLTYTGEDFYYSFANPLRSARLKWGTKERKDSYTWHVKAANKDSMVKLSITSPKDSMMKVRYENPDGSKPSPKPKAGAEGYGTIDLYRLTPAGKVWLDTLTIQNTLCVFEKPSVRR
ncbi:MAG: hypothetical protein K5678_00370 [Acetatifactor sp.]|nr:hypothetical protein [Acetatifactor sp.]